MGDARRRRLLVKAGILQPKPARPKFTAKLKGKVEDSYVAAEISDGLGKSDTLQFHLYQLNEKLYAEVTYFSDKVEQYGWIGSNINTISPLICRLVFEECHYSTISKIDRQSLQNIQ